MTDFVSSPTKDSVIRDFSKQEDSKEVYQVPRNSPASFSKTKDKEKYMITNGEKKNVKSKLLCTHHTSVKNINQQVEQIKTNSYQRPDNMDIHPVLTYCNVIQNEQRLISEKTPLEGENNVTASKDGSIKNLSLKKNVETNTDTEYVCSTMMPVTSNSSIINMKTSKPECEDQMFGATSSIRLLNIQKMPSVNIRPEFTIQSGPKINIASSSKSLYEVKRRNTEFFDVVYPTNSSLPSGSETRREIQSSLGSRMEHVCERHVFPSGKIIPGIVGDALRASYNVNDISVEDKKAILMDLIKSVCDKINKQETKGNNCRRLEYSLPLLASVVKKIVVDCVRCEEGLNRQIDTLIQLMKEEIRSHKEFSEEHCCQLIETVQYQIVELDLMQDDNSKEQSPTVKVFKHQENNGDSNVFKKTVSFENMQSELMRTSNSRKNVTNERKNEVKVVSNKNMSSKNKAESKSKPLLKLYNSQSSGEVQNTSGNRNKLMDEKSIKPKIQDKKIVNAIKTSHTTPRKTKNTSEGYKKKTIVEQVLKNITSKKPILKKDMSYINHASKEPSCNLNVLYKIVDKKETSNEFDQWIEERSLKIQRIHDELNNIVSRSTEGYLETNSGETQTIKEQIRTKYDNSSNKEDSGKEFTSSPDNKDQLACGSGEEERKESEEPCLSSSVQESNQDYVDDFEEDDEEEGEEKDDRNIEDSSINNNYENPIEGESVENTNEVAEAENGSSSSSKTSEIFTDENFEPMLMQQEEYKREKQGTYTTSDKDERDGYSDAVGTVLSVQELTEGSENQNQSKEKSQMKPEKVSIATSPITFGSSGEITLLKPNGLTSNKITIATSPINEVSKKTLEVETKMVQTETSSNDSYVIPNNKPHVEISRDDKPLQAPTFKLNPTPIESIVHVSLGQSSDSSLALQSSSTNQNIKLVVQLPNLSKGTDDNKKIIELDNLELQEQKQSLRKPNYYLLSEGERNTEFVNENNVPSAKYQNELPRSQEVGQIFTDPIYQSLNEKTIQDIIEPTVSEVLKKMNNTQFKLTPGISGHTEGDNNTINKYMPIYTEPSNPNIVLQTKHGLWKKCDDSPVYGFLDLERAKHVIDSSNQTETENKTVYTQVAASLAGSLTDKAVSVHNEEAVHTSRHSYIEMIQPLPPLATALNTTGSSGTHSSLFRTSSARTSSPTSTSSNRKSGHNSDFFLGYLSEGEILPKLCQCLFGEVCGVCIPKLDLSVGELKTKRRKEERNNILESGSDSHQTTSISSEKDSLARVPKSPLLEDLEILSNHSKANSKSGAKHLNQQMGLDSEYDLKAHYSQTIPVSGNVQIDTRKLTSKPFSEVVDSVMSELNKENLKIKKHNVRNRHINSGSFKNINLSTNKLTDSSSSGQLVKSGQSVSTSSSHERKLKYRNESRVPFVMKPPHESAKINVIVEDNDEVSISSYQTSVTSVSVDNLPAALSSYSSGEI